MSFCNNFIVSGVRDMKKFKLILFSVWLSIMFATFFVLPVGFTDTIEFWTFLDPSSPDPRGQALRDAIEIFERQYPDIKVNVTTIHWREIDQAAIRATAAGQGPDVLNVYTDQLQNHVVAGTLMPVEEFFKPWYTLNAEDYLWKPSMLEIKEHIWSTPWESRVWVLWYREDFVESVGAKVPLDLYELAEIAGDIRRNYPNVIGFAWGLATKSLGAEFIETFIPLLYGAGGELVDENGNAAFNDEAGIRVMEWLRALFVKYEATDLSVLSMDADDVLSGFQAGTIAMSVEGTMRVSTARSALGDKLKTAFVPSFESSEPSPGYTAGQTLGIGTNSQHPDIAWKFIEHMLSPEIQLIFAKGGILPVRSQVYNDSWFDTPEGKEMVKWRDYIIKQGMSFFPPEDYWKLCEILVTAAQRIVTTEVDIRSILDDAADEYNNYHATFMKE
ncbi:MAG: multiple sugar transport system substrate-binding protein [Candidatus Atribacteria bacterium]|nr:multiple sugar transport system substrate-binding protein [Candidatus Atribacteria bacterium]